MQIIGALNSIAHEINSRFVIIGGHAINAHGYSRSTGDIDLAILNQDAEKWSKSIQKIGYAIFHQQPAFIQFKSTNLDGWPIDLMLVDQTTFNQLADNAKLFKFRDHSAHIASVPHLISMKLHALKGKDPNREEKDLSDLIELLKLDGMDSNGETFRLLCAKYDTIWVYERLRSK